MAQKLDFVHTHTHVSVAKKFFAHMRKITTVLLNGGLTILTSNQRKEHVC